MLWLREIWDDLRLPLRALLVALTGVGLAAFWFEGKPWFAAVALLFLMGIGQAIAWFGERFLPRKPQQALSWLEWSVLAPAGLSAAAAALAIILGIELTVSEPAETKALAAALGVGMTAFVTTGFLSWTGDTSDSKVASRIREAFYRHYKRKGDRGSNAGDVLAFDPYSDGERWVYSNEFRGVEGWSRKARTARAQGIAEVIDREEASK